MLSERILIERLSRKDNSAFKEIVETKHVMVYNTVLAIVQNVEDAEDVAQEVFVQVYESIDGFKQESKLSTWLYRIAVSKAMDHLRRKKRKKRFAFFQSLFGKNDELVNDPPDFFHPGIMLENKQTAAVLFKAIKALPQNQHTAFILNKIEGLSYQEISDVMKLSVSAIDSLLQRAKTNLRKYLTNYYQQNA
ncbi:MAG: RNA polymerase sigma factor [Ginsengibacter sp.]